MDNKTIFDSDPHLSHLYAIGKIDENGYDSDGRDLTSTPCNMLRISTEKPTEEKSVPQKTNITDRIVTQEKPSPTS